MNFETRFILCTTIRCCRSIKSFRDKFIIPEADGKQKIYFLGNSLGLQPKSANDHIQQILSDWASLGVESFFHAKEPWMDYHDKLAHPLVKNRWCSAK